MNLLKTSVRFFRDAYYELAKSTWLGKKEVVGITVVVVIFVIIMSIFVSIVDMILGIMIDIVL